MKTASIIAATLALAIALAAAGFIYPTAMEITRIDGDDVYLVTATGFEYVMSGAEDYAVGDIVALVMFNNGTRNITDDQIVTARYSGYYFDR